ncbi:hypothetical protein [Hyalangium gracile]|uniref:hypothetical protein n=1 Tax=Hyalangium gracile TaxID=394092 RepID=UPI001CD03123|nr:hypothetical protein [Hyalangium gracile]
MSGIGETWRMDGGMVAGDGKAERRKWGRAWVCVLLLLAACGSSTEVVEPGAGDGDGTENVKPEPETPLPTPETCRPASCADRDASCGAIEDGCGGVLDCGGCQGGLVCGVHHPNMCGVPACKPRTCAEVQAQCGPVDDGCGGTLQCGTCAVGQTCGGGGKANACGVPDYGMRTACSPDGVCVLNPAPVAQDLKDVWGRSVKDFWAVGDAGYIVHGGETGLSMVTTRADLSGIWGSSAEAVWAVGSKILHFDGRRWSDALIPARFLTDVHGTSARNVWAVGEKGMAYSWDGSRWAEENTGTGADLYGVWTHRDQVWVVGSGATVRVREGKHWRSLPAPSPGVTLTGVWGTGPGDVWVTGSKSGAVLFHWDGRMWSSYPLPFSALYGISGTAQGEIVVVGEEGAARYDGSTWMPVLEKAPSRLLGVWHTADGVLTVGAAGRMHLSSERNVWIPLDRGARADFVSLSTPREDDYWWFADGATVRVGMDGTGYPRPGPANVLVEQSPGLLWAAGDHGRVNLHMSYPTSSGTHFFYLPETFSFRGVSPIAGLMAWLVGIDSASGEGLLIQLNGHAGWNRHFLSGNGGVNAIHGATLDDVWAVGDSVIAHWDGTAWTETRDALLPNFRAVRALDRGLAWALSPTGLWQWNGSQWTAMALPPGLGPTAQLHALFVDSRDEVYVAGDDGVLLRYNVESGAWNRIETGTRKSLRAFSGNRQQLIIAGEDGTVLRLYR